MMFSLVDDHLHGAIRAERPGRLADDDAVTRVGVARLVDLAAGVYAVGPTLEGRSAPVVAARSLAVHTATRAGYGAPIIARFVGVGPRAVRYLARRRLDPRAVLALRRRLALEERVQRGNHSDRGRSRPELFSRSGRNAAPTEVRSRLVPLRGSNWLRDRSRRQLFPPRRRSAPALLLPNPQVLHLVGTGRVGLKAPSCNRLRLPGTHQARVWPKSVRGGGVLWSKVYLATHTPKPSRVGPSRIRTRCTRC